MPEKRKRAKPGEGKSTRTMRQVLRRLQHRPMAEYPSIYELDPEEPTEDLYAALQRGVWLPIGDPVMSVSEGDAIAKIAGKSAGSYKAVSLRAWKGGEHRHAQLQMISEPLDE